MSLLLTIIKKDVLAAWRIGGAGALTVTFLLCVVSLVPFAFGPGEETLMVIAPAILWLNILLSIMLGLDRIFLDDKDQGSLDLLLSLPVSVEILVLAKSLAHWFSTVLPVMIFLPVFCIMLGVQSEQAAVIFISVLVGSPGLVLLGVLGAAISLCTGRGGMISSIVVIPLTIPLLIFGTLSCISYSDPLGNFWQPFLLLCSFTLFLIPLCTMAIAYILCLTQEP